MTDHKYFLLYANCILVKGYDRSSICDLQKNEVHLIPNSLAKILSSYLEKDISAIRDMFGKAYSETIDEYFDFLIKNELGFFIDTLEQKDHFPQLQLHWDYPFEISNCILDLQSGKVDLATISAIAQQLDKLCCAHLQIRFFGNIENPEVLSDILVHFNGTTVTNVEVVASYSSIPIDNWKDFCDKNIKVTHLTLHSGEENMETESDFYLTPVLCTTKVVNDIKSCGVINTDQYVINLPTFTESLHHNTCLNRKIAIDTAGNIKNCPSMQESFGNIKNTTLEEAINKPGFKKYWNIKKDEIIKCKDCEFRHVCTDCRAYREDPDDIYSAPLKCGYDPYTCTWEEWSVHPLKQKTIDYYGMRELVKDSI